MQTFEEALDWINSRLRFGIRPGLERMQWMMGKLGYPDQKLKVIHVGGTNGKGSTVTYIRSILNETGLKVGTFTSPFIESFNERISINGIPISNKEIVNLTNVIKPLAEEMEKSELGTLTEFEAITVMAIYYFANINPMDITIFEVGLGGRLDSTNILSPMLTIITNIGMDHTNILGDTVQKIAYEKAGIIKKDIPLITGAKQDEVLKILLDKSKEKAAGVYISGNHFIIGNKSILENGEQFSFRYDKVLYEDLDIKMLGEHQIENAALATMAATFMQIEEKHIREGLKKAFWPGRMEVIHHNPIIVLDGAHNPEGVKALAATINSHYPMQKKKIVFAALRDKDLQKMFQELSEIKGEFYFTQFNSPRVATAKELLECSSFSHAEAHENWQLLLQQLLRSMGEDEMLIVSGSLYFISDVKAFFKTTFLK